MSALLLRRFTIVTKTNWGQSFAFNVSVPSDRIGVIEQLAIQMAGAHCPREFCKPLHDVLTRTMGNKSYLAGLDRHVVRVDQLGQSFEWGLPVYLDADWAAEAGGLNKLEHFAHILHSS